MKYLLTTILTLVCFAVFAQTNNFNAAVPINPADAGDTLNQLVNWNNKLLGLPSGVLTLIVVFCFDAVLYYAEFFPNRQIPVFSMAAGAIIYFFMSWKVGADSMPTPVWITKNIVFGLIVGCAAWVLSLRYGMRLVGKMAGRPDPAPPLPEKIETVKIEPVKVEIQLKPNEPPKAE